MGPLLNKLYHALAIVSISTLLAIGGVMGVLIGGGKLTNDRAEFIVETLRGLHDDMINPPPEPESEPVEPTPDPVMSVDTVRAALSAKHLVDARIDRALTDLAHRQELLDQAAHELMTRGESFDAQVADWEAQRRRLLEADKDAGFKSLLDTVAKLDPKQGKAHLLYLWEQQPSDAVLVLNALSISKRQRILDEFTGPQETNVMNQLLERLRLMELDELVPQSGKTTGDAPS